MNSHESHVEYVRVCGLTDQIEASMIEQMLNEEGIATKTTGSSGTTVFGGLPFEEGYQIFVPHSDVKKTKLLLSKHPHFQGLDTPGES